VALAASEQRNRGERESGGGAGWREARLGLRLEAPGGFIERGRRGQPSHHAQGRRGHVRCAAVQLGEGDREFWLGRWASVDCNQEKEHRPDCLNGFSELNSFTEQERENEKRIRGEIKRWGEKYQTTNLKTQFLIK
jgi:hypothetical protein